MDGWIDANHYVKRNKISLLEKTAVLEPYPFIGSMTMLHNTLFVYSYLLF